MENSSEPLRATVGVRKIEFLKWTKQVWRALVIFSDYEHGDNILKKKKKPEVRLTIRISGMFLHKDALYV